MNGVLPGLSRFCTVTLVTPALPYSTSFAISRHYTVEITVDRLNGRLEATSVALASTTRPVTTVQWRQVKLGELVDRAAKRALKAERVAYEATMRIHRPDTHDVRTILGLGPGLSTEDWQQRRTALLDEQETDQAPAPRPRGGRPAHTDAHLRKVAGVYSKASEQRKPPVKAVQRAFKIPESTATHWVAAARRRGFLPKTKPGVPAGNIERTEP